MLKSLLIAAIVTTPLVPQVQRRAAGFIATYPQFVTWPKKAWKQTGDKILIGIIGRNPIGQAGITYLEEQGFEERLFDVQILRSYTRDQLDHFQILIIGEMPKKELRKLLKEIEDQPILTVGTDPDFLNLGGIIQLDINLKQRAVTWEVDLGNAKRAGLKVDPALIRYGMTM